MVRNGHMINKVITHETTSALYLRNKEHK